MFPDPNGGEALARQENEYLVENWDFFKEHFVFPHQVKIGGGNKIWFKNHEEFLKFLIMNQEASFMWSDHLQLQITANCYQVKVQVLSVNSKGEGSIQKDPFVPDSRLQKSSLLPEFRKDGKKMEVPEVWLMYDGNHYDALIKDDDLIITRGTIQECPVWRLEEKDVNVVYMEETQNENVDKEDDTDVKILQNRLRICESAKKAIEKNYKDAENVIKELQSENTTLKIQVKDLSELIDLESEEKKDSSVKNVDEEDGYISYYGDDEDGPWTKVKHKKKELKKKVKLECPECQYPFQDKDKLTKHVIQHRKPSTKKISEQKCSLCNKLDFESYIVYNTDKDLKEHIQTKHSTKSELDRLKCNVCNYKAMDQSFLTKHMSFKHGKKASFVDHTCELCDYKTTDKAFLRKHLNSKHYKKVIYETFSCDICDEDLDTKINLLKHIKEQHT